MFVPKRPVLIAAGIGLIAVAVALKLIFREAGAAALYPAGFGVWLLVTALRRALSKPPRPGTESWHRKGQRAWG